MGFDLAHFIRGDAKAIPAYPPLMAAATDPAQSLRIDDPARRKPFGQREAHRHLQAYGGTEAIDWVMNCVRLVVETAAGAKYHFEEEGERLADKKTPTTPPDMKLAPPMLTKLIREPNPYQSYEEFIQLTLIDYLLVGNAYWLKWQMNDAGQPLALYRLAPPLIGVVPGEFGVERYEYQLPGQKEPLKIPPEAIVHFKQANPHSPYFGLGLVKGGGRTLDLEIALTDTQASYFEKHAMPSAVLQSERRVPKDVFNKIKQQAIGMYSGSNKAGSLMILEAGLKFQSVAPSATDAAFKELSQQSRDRILAMFRASPVLFGIEGTEKVNEAQRIFDTKTMRPLLNTFQFLVSQGVTSAWGIDYVVDYEYVMPPEERLKLAGTIAALPGITVREIREAAGFQALGDPDIDDMVLNLPGEEGEEGDERNGFPDRNLPGEAGRPPLPENTKRFQASGAVPGGSQARLSKKSMSVEDILQRMQDLEVKAGPKVEPPDPLRSLRESEVDSLVATTQREINDAIHNLERALLDHIEGKAFRPNDLRGRIRRSVAWQTFSKALSEIMERAAQRAASSAVMHQAERGHRTDESIDYEALAKEIVYQPTGHKAIIKNLQDRVAKRLGENLDSQQDANDAVRQIMEDWRNSHGAGIALDTATESYNEATLTVAEALGRTDVDVIDGDDHDEPCKEAHGSTWPIEEARQRRKEHHRCRRAFVIPETT